MPWMKENAGNSRMRVSCCCSSSRLTPFLFLDFFSLQTTVAPFEIAISFHSWLLFMPSRDNQCLHFHYYCYCLPAFKGYFQWWHAFYAQLPHPFGGPLFQWIHLQSLLILNFKLKMYYFWMLKEMIDDTESRESLKIISELPIKKMKKRKQERQRVCVTKTETSLKREFQSCFKFNVILCLLDGTKRQVNMYYLALV